MSRKVFICNTVFQVLVATWINHKYFRDCKDTDIIISNHMNGASDISDRMQQYGEFANTYFVESLDVARYRIPETHFSHMKNEINPGEYIKRTFGIDFAYDHIFVSNLDGFTKQFFSAAVKENPNVNVHIFEDGLSTYSKLFGSWFRDSGRPNYDLLRGVVYDYVYRKKYIKDYIKDIWLLTPELLQWNPEVSVKTVEKINPKDEIYLEICNKVFGYYDSKDVYDKKYIFMEESFFADGKEIPDVELVNQIAQQVGKENIMVKIHPRNPVNRFEKLGYKTNRDTGIPWELICMNMTDLDEKVLLTVSSNSILNPIMIFGIPVRAFSLYGVINQSNNSTGVNEIDSPVWDVVRLGYQKYKPSIVICDSIEEIK